MPIAELFLGALLPVLFERLASRELLDFARREGIHKLLKKWEELLISIDKVLYDAEDRQLSGDPDVEPWLKDLRNLAYDIDDLLDEFATKSAENKSKAEPGCSKVRSLLPSSCFRSSSCAIMFDCKMRSKIEEMDSRLREIITKKERLRLSENNREQSGYRRQDKLDSTTNLTENCFVSREDDKKSILKLLTGEEDDKATADLNVIPIVGMGGVGKTALAQQVYNDSKVDIYFDVKAWVCVSDVFNVPAVTKSLLETVDKDLFCGDKDLNWLQNELKKNLAAKKFLIVLDDVWNENYGKWTELLKPFRSGAKGSKILLTTRNRVVASIADAPSYDLRELSTDASMPMFAFHATKTGNFNHCPELEVLGRQIVAKCQGLPLAVKTLAGLLRTKDNPQDWEEVLNSKIWDLREGRNEILPSLKLSYLHLPSNLRRCFAYCAIFPKDYEIERDELIRWWSAEGLLEEKGGKNRRNVGLSCFDELVSRSLFQKSSNNGSRFLMHDLVNDLAKLVAGGSYFGSGELEPEGDQNDAFLARHASVIFNDCIVPKRFKKYHKMKGLRSFISLVEVPTSWSSINLSQKVLSDLLLELKCLRVLSLSHYNIEEIPDCVGKLSHLRHLNLSYTKIITLPKSIVGLFNLEDLILQDCRRLVELPKDMEKLINLRFLDITDTPCLRAMPPCVGNMVGLEMLSKFVVETKTRSRLDELKNLENLRGELCISDLHEVREAKDATDANLCMKEGIRRLTMQWCEGSENLRDEELEAEVLNRLLPPRELENLTISFFGALKFPSWLGSPLYVNMVHIRLYRCCRAEALPSLGQLTSLKELYIEGLKAICKVGSEFYGAENPFLSLITLEFKDLPLWEDWSHCIGTEEGVLFPRLERLVIEDCPKLIGRLPSQLSPLIELRIAYCPRMDASLPIIRLPSLKKLNFCGCNEGVLKSFVNLTSLTELVLSKVTELTCLNHGFTSSLISLEKLVMEGCGNLLYLWEDTDVAQNLACLTRLDVENCPNFMSFAVGEGDIELPGKLETMYLQRCINLEKLPSNMHTLCSLGVLSVQECPKLVSFPETGIPRSVTSLSIEGCEMLQSLPIGLSTHPNESSSSSSRHSDSDASSCLQELIITNCDCLGASPFSEGRFLPATLKRLVIGSCKGVESLAEINAARLHSLQEIAIGNCENLRSLPEGLHTLTNLTSLILNGCPVLEMECLPPLPPNITSIKLKKCPEIKSLPNQLHRLTCLRDLAIKDCESITRFPDGGLPPQLRCLEVLRCGNMKQPVREWLTPRLTSLEYLCIDGSAGGVGEGVDLVLPLIPSLLHLWIGDTGKVERVASSLPPSLRRLYFYNCPKLRELPRDGLPPSLEVFVIFGGCGVLKERCRKGTGRYWPLLHEIPRVELWD